MPHHARRRLTRRLMATGALLVASVAVAQIGTPRKEIVQPIPPGASAALPQGSPDWNATQTRLLKTADVGILAQVDEWKRLRGSDALGFGDYARFLMAHPGWPDESRMRGLAERAADPQTSVPEIISFFRQFPPRTASGAARYAIALMSAGMTSEARSAARSAWRMGAMSTDDEALMLGQFAASFTADDHDAHADAALFTRNSSSAERVLGFASPQMRPVIAARIAMQRLTPDAGTLMQAADAYAKGHAGYIADKAQWLGANGNTALARDLLAGREPLVMRPANVERWYELLLSNARAAAKEGQFSLAYGIASRIDDAYAPGMDVSTRPLGERDDYTSLAWLAGTLALDRLGRPQDAAAMFLRYANAARSPQSMSKGYYWAARAAAAAGNNGASNRDLQMAAAYPDQYYGQLALEKLGRTVPAPRSLPSASANERARFEGQSLVRAIRALGLAGRWSDQSFFVRALASNVATDAERGLASELAATTGRPDLGVMVGRRARADGSSAYNLASFPTLPVPADHEAYWTIIHAIARQESQFDKAAVSHAGARGLMQLMPGTARETAGKIGLVYLPENLTSDTGYNIQLGNSYFQRLLTRYGGSYPLAIAAYNAGAGNVNKWLAANGDPRLPGGDIVRWIESIPFSETRNYVQRVLENAVVYDVIHAQRQGYASAAAPLSRYLGKSVDG
ncbi:MAG: lytic transglycosylase domain-containing protein [Sphingobium sp.]|jgi:soluble lytic murein transglycosylase|nr:lytic transglycosylase domain-containing protein [Sphingobium sp.]MCI1272403.1 lytic transglycosylase domain-containing protein [Sphingobium sp.]MCI1754448.1 lytic transglycosylase domain-containing protein [Sphingobium sp.]MCI2053755.1 lytic transglycosylase domain-containing protein [Sphingobium sp.]